MRRIICLIISIALMLTFASSAYAKLSGSAKVNATVGEYYLNLSGFASPFASIILTTDGVFLRATVADAQGNFYISQVLIKDGFSHFCLESVDFKRVGQSITCINIPAAHSSVTKKNIFLPPTLGLSKYVASAGEKILAFGYTMPGAKVNLDLGKGRILTTNADQSGYYVFTLKDLPAGNYTLFATAVYKGQQSLSPSKGVQLKSLSLWEKILQFLKDLFAKIIAFFTSSSLGLLWLCVPIIILIIILIFKLWPGLIPAIWPKIFVAKKKKDHLHHYWLVGE